MCSSFLVGHVAVLLSRCIWRASRGTVSAMPECLPSGHGFGIVWSGKKTTITGWWFQPIPKTFLSLDSSSNRRGPWLAWPMRSECLFPTFPRPRLTGSMQSWGDSARTARNGLPPPQQITAAGHQNQGFSWFPPWLPLVQVACCQQHHRFQPIKGQTPGNQWLLQGSEDGVCIWYTSKTWF